MKLAGGRTCWGRSARRPHGVKIKNQGMGQVRTDLSNANLSGVSYAGAGVRRSLISFANLKGSGVRTSRW